MLSAFNPLDPRQDQVTKNEQTKQSKSKERKKRSSSDVELQPAEKRIHLEAWLGSEGFPLEYKIARLLRAAGFKILRGIFVEDPETQKSLEVDVHAACNAEKAGVHYIVEAKTIAPSRAWVFFSGDRPPLHRRHVLSVVPASLLGAAAMWAHTRAVSPSHLEAYDPIASNSGKLVFQAKSVGFRRLDGDVIVDKGNDTVYLEFNKVIKKARRFAVENDERAQAKDDEIAVSLMVVPLVVVDGGPLFVADYDDQSDSLRVTEHTHVRVFWTAAPGTEAIMIDVVTLDLLSAGYADELYAASRELADDLHEASSRLVRFIEPDFIAVDDDPELAKIIEESSGAPELIAGVRRQLRQQRDKVIGR